MSNFQGDYLRVLTPITSDGTQVEYGPDGRIKFKESHAPLESKQHFERENRRLPNGLKHILEEVRTGFGNVTTPQPTQTKVKLK